ncbi:unnamed protein product [Microthlaspi erraticum]|uniref:Uncharacterized protein n=1 Tax=Microthlaspi erraticum TaxID=1685480 RepID=A0A6D2I8K1_9BRAS|nr:unnamed protein product [Microthlaspi erraticum]
MSFSSLPDLFGPHSESTILSAYLLFEVWQRRFWRRRFVSSTRYYLQIWSRSGWVPLLQTGVLVPAPASLRLLNSDGCALSVFVAIC